MATRDDADDLDLALAGTWRKDDGAPLERWALRAGGERYELIADRKTADALFELLRALPPALERLRRERDRMAAEVDDLATERDAMAKRAKSPASAGGRAAPAAPRPERGGPTALADVPLSMIGTFRPDDPRIKAAAKKDPLMALAVQVAKATDPGASDLDRARLRAMAAAVSRDDMDTFWSASTERSKKKLGG
jgi:hypothetical protein